jgi:hypothetical protein
MNPSGRKERTEPVVQDGPLDPPHKPFQEADEWSECQLGEFSLAKTYLDAQVGVEVSGRFSAVEVKPRYWVAFFERCRIESQETRWLKSLRHAPIHSGYPEGEAHHEQQSVLVDDVQAVQLPDGASPGVDDLPIWSAVRLGFFERPEDAGVSYLGSQLSRLPLTLFVESVLRTGNCVWSLGLPLSRMTSCHAR